MSDLIPIRVNAFPEDAFVTFDDECSAILTWTGMPTGWHLDYRKADGDNGDYPIGGQVSDVEWALHQARTHLVNVRLA